MMNAKKSCLDIQRAPAQEVVVSAQEQVATRAKLLGIIAAAHERAKQRAVAKARA